MSRSIELGRAVLSSPATDHELWLTTFITVSPKQHATYLQQLTSAQCLDVLMSGAVWVSRGHDMHIEMKLNLREELLPHKQLQDLTNAVLHAPVWDQLRLKPTQRTDVAVDPGTIHLYVNHASATGMQEEKRRHRLFSGVPAADVRSPEGITAVSLQSVRLCMNVLETRPRRRLTTKRSNSSPSERKVRASDKQDSDTLLHEMASDELFHDSYTNRSPTAPRAAANRKRKRPATETVSSNHSNPLDGAEDSRRQRSRLVTDSFIHRESRPGLTSSGRTEVTSMVDGALRLSICGTLNKMAVGWKVKASTFHLGLADVAPAIWRTGYLDALSQRAHLLPTIARSLAQLGSVNSTSITIRDKMKSVKKMAQEASLGCSIGKGPNAGYHVAEIESAIAGRLWVQSQKSLLDRPMATMQACVASSPCSDQSDSDDMLAEEEPRWHHSSRTTSFHNDNPPGFSNDESTSTAYAQKIRQQERLLGSPDLDVDVRESEDDLLLDSHPQDTVFTTACPVTEQLQTPCSLDGYPSSIPLVPMQKSSISESQCRLSILQSITPFIGPAGNGKP